MEILFGDKHQKLDKEKYFVASKEPLYYGLIINPSSELWSYMVESHSIKSNIDGKILEYSIPYRIDVGENTIFFIKLMENY